MNLASSRFLTPFRSIIVLYIIAIILFSILLFLPISHLPEASISYSEALFTAVSAVSVAGLSVVPISETFNYIGVTFLAIAIQLGGIGIMTLGTFVWLVLGKEIILSQRMLIMIDHNQTSFSGLVNLMKGILLVAFLIEIVGGLLLGSYYLTYFDTAGEAYYQGFFASLSAFTNAGFDLTGQSLQPFANDYIVQLIIVMLIFLGAIGFPVLMEVKHYFWGDKVNFKFSLFTKITTTTYFIVFVLGAMFIWILESGNSFVDLPWYQQLVHSLFSSATTRSAGFTTMTISEFSMATLLLLSVLMIIGASPSSAGGGIRTTTLAVLFLTIRSFALGRSDVKVFGREIHSEDQQKSFIVLTVFSVLLFAAIFLIAVFERSTESHLLAIIFEACSAFGTAGLSLGITPFLSQLSQVVLMVLMLIGRIGLVAFLFSIRKKEAISHYKYPTERIIIG